MGTKKLCATTHGFGSFGCRKHKKGICLCELYGGIQANSCPSSGLTIPLVGCMCLYVVTCINAQLQNATLRIARQDWWGNVSQILSYWLFLCPNDQSQVTYTSTLLRKHLNYKISFVLFVLQVCMINKLVIKAPSITTVVRFHVNVNFNVLSIII